MSQATFLHRQALYLRPDPARVIVRPFKPATEPRDLNPTDKTRANHIVERVLALDPKVAAHQLADVLASRLRSKAYDRLVIVAAPSALGDLRAAISEQVRAKVTGEVAKDLTKTPDGEVAGHLKDVLSA